MARLLLKTLLLWNKHLSLMMIVTFIWLYNIGSMMISGWSLWWYDGKNALAVNKLQSLWSWFSLNSYVLAVHIFFLFEFPPFQQFHEHFECLSETNVASAILRRTDWLGFCCVQILSATSNHSEYLSYIQIAEIQRQNFSLTWKGQFVQPLQQDFLCGINV